MKNQAIRFLLVTAALSLAVPAFADSAREGLSAAPGRTLLAQKRKKGKKKRKKPAAAPVPEAAPEEAPTEAVTESLEASDAGGDAAVDEGGEVMAAGNTLRRSNRMEFDARVIKGQTATSGAVYLFQRAPRQLPPLLKLKQSYLKLIVEPVLGPQGEEEVK